MATVIYNSYTLPNVYGKFFFNESFEKMSFRCTFLVTAATEALLVAACAAAETALRQPYQTLTLSFGGTAEYNFNHTSNTYLNPKPNLSAITDEKFTALTRPYQFEVSADLPADRTGVGFRRRGDYTVDTSIINQRTVTFQFEYTAGGGDGSLENFNDGAENYAENVLSDLGVSLYKIANKKTTTDQEDKITTGSIVYKEILNLVEVTYGDYTIENTIGDFIFSEDYEKFTFAVDFVIEETTTSALVSSCEDAETALRLPYQDLTVKFNTVDQYSFKHSENTALLTFPSLQVLQNNFFGQNRRTYRFQCVAQLPANLDGFNFRQKGSFAISKAATGRLRVTFRLTYTAGGSSTSRENWDAFATTYAASVLTAIGGTFNLVAEDLDSEHEEKITSGTLVYQELLDEETALEFDDTDIFNVQMSCGFQPGQTIGLSDVFQGNPMSRISVRYSCEIAKTVDVTNFQTFYETKIRPHMIAHCGEVLGLDTLLSGASAYICDSENFDFANTEYRVNGSMSLSVPRSIQGEIISVRENLSEIDDEGIIWAKVWDGNRDTIVFWELGGHTLVNRTIYIEQIGSQPDAPAKLDSSTHLYLGGRKNVYRERRGIGTQKGRAQAVDVFVVNFEENYVKYAEIP